MKTRHLLTVVFLCFLAFAGKAQTNPNSKEPKQNENSDLPSSKSTAEKSNIQSSKHVVKPPVSVTPTPAVITPVIPTETEKARPKGMQK